MKFELRFYGSKYNLAKNISRTIGVDLLEKYFNGRDIADIESVIKWSSKFSVSTYQNSIFDYRILFSNLDYIYENNLQEVFKNTSNVSVEVPEGFLVPFIKIRHIINPETRISTQLEYYVDEDSLIKYWIELGCPNKIEY